MHIHVCIMASNMKLSMNQYDYNTTYVSQFTAEAKSSCKRSHKSLSGFELVLYKAMQVTKEHLR